MPRDLSNSFFVDRESCEYKAFGSFLTKLDEGFIVLSEEAKKDLVEYVELICHRSYDAVRGVYKLNELHLEQMRDLE